jgi:hypothetical protein
MKNPGSKVASVISRTASRREILQSFAAVALATRTEATASTGAEAAVKPTLNAYASYAWLRGFSVVPSRGPRIEEAWWAYDPGRMREEIAPARLMHANCIRLWIEFTAWMADPAKVAERFLDAVAAISQAGMKTMPCLFNRWHDLRYDYGGTYLETIYNDYHAQLAYVRALVAPLAKDDRVLIWDLCNEPQAGAPWATEVASEPARKEHEWLAAVARTVRECGACQPITIGTMSGKNIEAYADICDVLCGHPYAHDRAGLEQLIASFKDLREKYGKPFLVNECIPGAEVDAERGQIAKLYGDLLSENGFGWMGWALREGKAISTRRDRVDANGLRGFGFHPFALKNGKLRTGLEYLTEKPKVLPPWEKQR